MPRARTPIEPVAKVLSLQQPWAHLVIAGIKRIENRSWTTAYRGLLWIHASNGMDRESVEDYEDELPPIAQLVRGAILGSVQLVEIYDADTAPRDVVFNRFGGGPCYWLLADPQPLATPFKCPGKLRLWNPPATFKEK